MTNHPTNEAVKELGALIDTINQKQLDYIIKRCRRRITTLAEEKALDALEHAKLGKTVRLSGLKPQYLNGLRGTIADIDAGNNKISITLINPPARAVRRYAADRRPLTVPANCCTVID